MKKYAISLGERELATGIEAENAIAALDRYCSATPDDDTGFQRGGLNCDAETGGGKSASVRTDGGRITADVEEFRRAPRADTARQQQGVVTNTITIKTVKRTSGYQARYELDGAAPVRCVGHATREDAIEAAKVGIKRTMDTRVPGMSNIQIEVGR